MITIINQIYNNQRSDSLATILRKKRLILFKNMIESLPTPIKLLDVGGTINFWENTDFLQSFDKHLEITIINIYPDINSKHPNIKQVIGDARNMAFFQDNEFDVVFSNSVIEHVGGYDEQHQMAREIMRVGKKYFVQTPNLFFPIEPHFVFPFFQFLPLDMRVFLLMHFDLGWKKKNYDRQKAKEIVTEIQLLSKAKFSNLFPSANMYEEKLLGLTKSFIVYGG